MLLKMRFGFSDTAGNCVSRLTFAAAECRLDFVPSNERPKVRVD
jgi:hypothetical protein